MSTIEVFTSAKHESPLLYQHQATKATRSQPDLGTLLTQRQRRAQLVVYSLQANEQMAKQLQAAHESVSNHKTSGM
jgi:DNA-binding CsgD family transcriptional regulator